MANLEQAIKDCQEGRSESFGVVYDQFVKKIYNYLYFRTGHKETAEDLTSVTFTKALDNLASFNEARGTFSAWIYRIARNTLIDHYRTGKITFELTEMLDIKSRTDLETEFDINQKLSKVIEYFNRLPQEHRELLTMRIWDDLSYREIADLTGKSEASLKMAVSRIMTRFKSRAAMALILFLIS